MGTSRCARSMDFMLLAAPRAALLAVTLALLGCAPRSIPTVRGDGSANAPPMVVLVPAGEEIVVRTGDERRKLGLSPLPRNDALMRAAQLHANQMAAARTMAHELPGAQFPTLGSRLAAVGYRMRASGENVAEGQPTPAAVVAGWMTSPGHRANIVSPHFTEMGAGVATSTAGRRFYVQVFGAPQ